MKPNHRVPWTTEALEELGRLADQGLTAREIADRVGRTEEAIRLKARLGGFALAKSQLRPEEKAGKRAEAARKSEYAIDEMVRRSIERHGP